MHDTSTATEPATATTTYPSARFAAALYGAFYAPALEPRPAAAKRSKLVAALAFQFDRALLADEGTARAAIPVDRDDTMVTTAALTAKAALTDLPETVAVLIWRDAVKLKIRTSAGTVYLPVFPDPRNGNGVANA